MKKLLLFLLVLAGGVSTASAKTIYFVDNWGLSSPDFKVYMYNSNTDYKTTWANRESLVSTGTIDNRTYYTIDLDNWSHFVITFIDQSKDKQTIDLDAATYPDDSYIEFNDQWSGENAQVQTATIYTYTFNITTSEDWSTFNVHLWEYNTKNNKTAWPGNAAETIDELHYSYTFKSYLSKLGVLFNKGDGAEKTCDMVAEPGDNYYNICGVNTNGYGEYVKTNAYGYATFYNETYPITVPTGIAFVAEDLNNGSAKAYNITDVPLHTPMLIKATAANTYYHFAKPASDPAALTITNAFKAGTGTTVASTENDKYNYILNGDSFYKAAGKTVGTKKAYLQLSQAATARLLLFDDEEETTGITSIKSENSDIYFDLQGRRVAQPTKGLYIVNGKKYFAK